MIADDVSGAIFWGATWRLYLRKRSENPFPDSPGWYVKRKAWFFGYDNAVDVLSKSDGLSPDDPVYDDIRNTWKDGDGHHTRRTTIRHHEAIYKTEH